MPSVENCFTKCSWYKHWTRTFHERRFTFDHSTLKTRRLNISCGRFIFTQNQKHVFLLFVRNGTVIGDTLDISKSDNCIIYVGGIMWSFNFCITRSRAMVCQSSMARFFSHSFHSTIKFICSHCTWLEPTFIRHWGALDVIDMVCLTNLHQARSFLRINFVNKH